MYIVYKHLQFNDNASSLKFSKQIALVKNLIYPSNNKSTKQTGSFANANLRLIITSIIHGCFTNLFQFRLDGHAVKWISSIHLPLDLVAHFNYMRTAHARCTLYTRATATTDPDKVVGTDAAYDAIELISIEQHCVTK